MELTAIGITNTDRAIVTAALALLAFSWGAARLKPTALTVSTLLEPLTVVILSTVLLGQSLNAMQLLGGALLLLSIWVTLLLTSSKRILMDMGVLHLAR